MINKKIMFFLIIVMIVLSKAGISHGLGIESQFIPGLNTINDFTYGSGLYIQACNSGQIRYSKDLKVWNSVKLTNSDLIGIKYMKGLFITVDKADCIYISKDCAHWSKQNDFDGCSFSKMLYINQAVFLVGKHGNIAKTTDGKSWKLYDSLKSVDIKDMVYNGKVYSAIGNYAGGYVVIYYSKDLKNWKQAYHGIYYADNAFWNNLGIDACNKTLIAYYSEATGSKQAYNENYYILTSNDGIKWVLRKTAAGGFILNITPFNSGYILLCSKDKGYPDYEDVPYFQESASDVFSLDQHFKTINSISTKSERMQNMRTINGRIFIYGCQGCFEIFKDFNDIKNSVDYKRELPEKDYNSYCLFDETNSRYLFSSDKKIITVNQDGSSQVLYEGSNVRLIKADHRFIAIDSNTQQNDKGKKGLVKSIGNLDIYLSTSPYNSGQIIYDSLHKRLVKYDQYTGEGLDKFIYEFDFQNGEWKSIKAEIDSSNNNETDIQKFFTAGEFTYVNHKFFITTAYGGVTSDDCIHWNINVSTKTVMGNNDLRFGSPMAYDEKNEVYLSFLMDNDFEKSGGNGRTVTIPVKLSEDAFRSKSSTQPELDVDFLLGKPGYNSFYDGYNSFCDSIKYVFLLKDKNLFITTYGNICETSKNYDNTDPNDQYAGKEILYAYQSENEVICLTEDFEILRLR